MGIQQAIHRALGDGARASKFDVEIQFKNTHYLDSLEGGMSDANYVIKTAALPGRTHEKIDFMYRGKSIPIKGYNKYSQTWTCTFLLTEDHSIKSNLELWMESLDNHSYFTKDSSLVASTKTNLLSDYTSEIHIKQKNFDADSDTAVYKLYNVFPTEVSELSYGSDTVNEILELSVTFSFSHYELEKSQQIELKAMMEPQNNNWYTGSERLTSTFFNQNYGIDLGILGNNNLLSTLNYIGSSINGGLNIDLGGILSGGLSLNYQLPLPFSQVIAQISQSNDDITSIPGSITNNLISLSGSVNTSSNLTYVNNSTSYITDDFTGITTATNTVNNIVDSVNSLTSSISVNIDSPIGNINASLTL